MLHGQESPALAGLQIQKPQLIAALIGAVLTVDPVGVCRHDVTILIVVGNHSLGSGGQIVQQQLALGVLMHIPAIAGVLAVLGGKSTRQQQGLLRRRVHHGGVAVRKAQQDPVCAVLRGQQHPALAGCQVVQVHGGLLPGVDLAVFLLLRGAAGQVHGGRPMGKPAQGGGIEGIFAILPPIQHGDLTGGDILAHQLYAGAIVGQGGVNGPVTEGQARGVAQPRLAAPVPVGAAGLGAQGQGLAGGVVIVSDGPADADVPAAVVGIDLSGWGVRSSAGPAGWAQAVSVKSNKVTSHRMHRFISFPL